MTPRGDAVFAIAEVNDVRLSVRINPGADGLNDAAGTAEIRLHRNQSVRKQVVDGKTNQTVLTTIHRSGVDIGDRRSRKRLAGVRVASPAINDRDDRLT